MFHIGQKVVCIKTGQWSAARGEITPVRDRVYTVRAIRIFPNGIAGLLLHEIVNEPMAYREGGVFEAHFCATRFRPVIERKTDISVFTAMLTPSPTRELETVHSSQKDHQP